MALASVDRVTFGYPGATRPALDGVSFELADGETVALLGPSGSGKSTLLRALAGLVPHFHGGRFSGRVVVAGQDTRSARPAELAGTVATVFQDPEDQVVMTRVENEVAFGLGCTGVPGCEIPRRAAEALAAVGCGHLARRRTSELSGGELQRVELAAALALRPRLLLLDEPTSQLDPAGAAQFLELVRSARCAVVLSEQRVARALAVADRVVFVECGRILVDAPRDAGMAWLDAHRPAWLVPNDAPAAGGLSGLLAASIENVSFSYGEVPVLDGASLTVARGEIVALEGPNGVGKSTLARVAAGLLEPARGRVVRSGRAAYLSQDPGRYVVCETALEEVALAVGGDAERARVALDRVGLAWAAERHPRDLSSGERERLAVAAVAVGEPDLLVLDEPTRGVDPDRKRELGELVEAYARAGRGVLVVTHDRDFRAHRRVALERPGALRAA